jgi:hypothetical protein
MKVITLLAVIFALAQGWNLGVSPVQAECTEVYFQLYGPGQDPPCGFTPDMGWSIRVTTSPSSVSAGTCSAFTLDNLYADVEFWEESCAIGDHHVCDIVATDDILSGYYEITDVSGSCFTVCGNCTP